MTDRPQLRRSAARQRLAAAHGEDRVATPAQWTEADKVIVTGAVSDEET